MIIVNNEDCIKCGACEGTCPSAAIKVTPDNVINCDICGGDAKCVSACSKGALSIEPIAIGDEGITKNRIIFNPLKCDECGDCSEVCPTQTLKLKKGAKMPLEGFCVLCQKCVNICPVEVIGLEGVKEPKSTNLEIKGAVYISDCVGCKMCVCDVRQSERVGLVCVNLKTAPMFDCVFGLASCNKSGNQECGDCHSIIRLSSNRFLLALCRRSSHKLVCIL